MNAPTSSSGDPITSPIVRCQRIASFGAVQRNEPLPLPACEIGGSQSMHTWRPEKRPILEGPLQPIVDFALPRISDAAICFDRTAGDLEVSIGVVALRVCRGASGFFWNVIPGVCGVPRQRATRFRVEGQIRELMLERLELANCATELFSLICIGNGELDASL